MTGDPMTHDDRMHIRRQTPLEKGFYRAPRRCRLLGILVSDPDGPVSEERLTLRGPDGAIVPRGHWEMELGPGEGIHVTVDDDVAGHLRGFALTEDT